MADRPTPARLREAIALTLQAETKEYETEAVCDRLGMPPGEWTHNSKRVYVQNRLAGVELGELVEIGRRVVDEFGDDGLEALLGAGGLRGVDGELKNLIFAADGPKPRIVMRDAINNVIEIVDNAEHVLVYDRSLEPDGLRWGQLVDWWNVGEGSGADAGERELYRRLAGSLQSEEERILFRHYCASYGGADGDRQPALIPQVYLHYDPYTRRELAAANGEELTRQRMDFLLLLPNRARIVLEVDGQQHYSENGLAAPGRYASMVREDRAIRLGGYEVYRFAASELREADVKVSLDAFFDDLLSRHGVG